MKFKLIKGLIFCLILIGLAGVFFFYHPEAFREMSSVDGLIRYARSFGQVMPAAVFGLTFVQAILPMIPFVLICSANGLLLGMIPGILLTLAASLAGASVVYFTARYAEGRLLTRYKERLMTQQREKLQGFRGFWIVLALRLTPYVPSPAINVLAGASRLNFGWFLSASVVGKVPFIVGYTILGNSIFNSGQWVLATGILIILVVIPYWLSKRQKKAVIIKGED